MRLVVSVLLACVLASVAHASDVIVHPGLQQPTVSRALLRGIFGMRVRVWPDGTPIQVFVLDSNSSTHAAFCRDVLRVYPYQLENTWQRLVYSGTGQSPVRVGSLDEMRELVASSPGAIGYINESTPAVAGDNSIRILHVE